MGRTVGSLMILLLLAVFAYGQDDTAKFPSCKHCGMNRETFNHSRMLIGYDDSTSTAVCSIHCAAIDLALNIGRTPKRIDVADYISKKLIDAENAVWVIGGNRPGVMSVRAKWAFESRDDAENFIRENGGTLAVFDEAIKAAYEDMYQDNRMIREKRKMKTGTEGEMHHHH